MRTDQMTMVRKTTALPMKGKGLMLKLVTKTK